MVDIRNIKNRPYNVETSENHPYYSECTIILLYTVDFPRHNCWKIHFKELPWYEVFIL